MLELLSLLGRQSVAALWLPVALWTVLALVAEAGLRLSRSNAAVGLPVRGAVLVSLPLALGLAAVVRVLAPRAASAVAAVAPAPLARLPEIVRLPEVVVGGSVPATVATETAPPVAEALIGLLVVLAAVVGVVGLVRLAADAVRLRRTRRDLPPAPPEVQEQLERARVRLGLVRPVAAVQAPPEAVPFTVGWRRPIVAVPADLDGPELDAVLTHELAHVERGDFAWHAAQRVVAAVFAAHPLVHVLGRGLDLDRERAADAAVLATHPSARRTYADLLLSYASLPPPPFALGAAPGASSLKFRIDAMTRPLSPGRLRLFGALGRTLAAFTLVLTVGLALVAAAPGSADVPSEVRVAVVEGLVTDADTDDPLVGADLRVIGTPVSTVTGPDGRYRLDAPDGEQAIRVLYPGYEPRTVRLAEGQTELDVALTTANVGGEVITRRDRPMGEDPDAPEIFEVAEVQPRLIGGIEGLQNRIVYPPEAKADSVEGRVIIQFIVDEEGQPTDITVLRSPDERLSEAAIQAVRASRFEPGMQRGEPVKVRFAVPVTFRLRGEGGEDQGAAPEWKEAVVFQIDYANDIRSLLDRKRTNREVARIEEYHSESTLGLNVPLGEARVVFDIDAVGAPTNVRVLSATDPTLVQFARRYISAARFRPEAHSTASLATVRTVEAQVRL